MPCGSWPSPIRAADVAAQAAGPSSLQADGGALYWLEMRPQEGGRYALVRGEAGGGTTDVTAPATNVRTRVHEYGGGSFLVASGNVFFVEFADQRLYLQRGTQPARPLTPVAPLRFADFALDRTRSRLVCVREDHRTSGEPRNELVAVPCDAEDQTSTGVVLATGYDFYASPRLSPDGGWLAWVAWRHPHMPWDATELWLGRLGADGSLVESVLVAGGEAESVMQPGWSPDGDLYFVSDRSGWWRLHRVPDVAGQAASGLAALMTEPVPVPVPPDAEFGRAPWALGTVLWTCAGRDRIVATCTRSGRSRLVVLDLRAGTCTELLPAMETLDNVAVVGDAVVFVGASPTRLPEVLRIELGSQEVTRLRVASPLAPDEYLSTGEFITFPTDDGVEAHGFYYAPRNPGCGPLPGERPPLLVMSHGGPTDAARASLRPTIQYWTSRGIAVVDVDYGGSTGYGRAYRERLKGRWGIVDVADCVNAARFLVSKGRADAERLAIRGGSAGGYTTLAALTFRAGVFKAGASYYGVSDLEALARDTHKFEARYLDGLVGPYPAARDVYRARSPIHAVDRLSCPLILLHGAEDRVVPPNQAQMMADALASKGLPVALMVFEGEQHGFRRAANLARALEAELWFYGTVFGFTAADEIEPVPLWRGTPAQDGRTD
jgi:dipeptidyl aminopeptidase/acylaminoacyl peptidase